jgi:hypothetical protein
MKNLTLTVTIFIVLSLLLVTGPFTAVLASPGRIEDPGLELATDANGNSTYWTFSEDDADYDIGTRSAAWKSQGSYSYLLSATAAKIGGSKYAQIAQSVNFNLLDAFVLDCRLYCDTLNGFEARVLADGTQVWSKVIPTTETSYLRERIDVSAITTTGDLTLQVMNIGGTADYTLTCYFDNIKLWGSHSDATWTTVCNSFADSTNHVYMYGENFDAGTTKVGWYDGNDDWMETDTYVGWGGGILDWSECDLLSFAGPPPTAAAGTWHAVVLLQGDDMPATYAGAIADPDFVADDSFIVDATAIPEFPEVMAAIGVAGLCFGIYYWMRKRRLRTKFSSQ